MKIEKEIIDRLDHCYACANIVINGKNHYLAASEERNACHIIEEETGRVASVWDDTGGTMSIVPLPGRNGEFLASQRFYPGFQAEEAAVVWARLNDQGWQVKTLFNLPYIHRFDVLASDNGKKYFIGCTLCETKKSAEDWSSGGHVMAGELPENLEEPFELKSILSGLVHNHGYYRTKADGLDACIVTCDSGAYRVMPPGRSGDGWSVRQILPWAISDLAMIDMDGDGKDEIVTIEPFHGNSFHIYKEAGNSYEKVYEYPGRMAFGHVVWGGMLAGVPTVLGGFRGLSKSLFHIQYIDGVYRTTTIDEGVGPCNIFVVRHETKDMVIAANGAVNEIARYTFSK